MSSLTSIKFASISSGLCTGFEGAGEHRAPFDECDVMFAHARLQTGTERYQAYFASGICRSGCGWLKWGS